MATRKAGTAESAAASKASKVAKAVQSEVKEVQQKVAQVKEAVEEAKAETAKADSKVTAAKAETAKAEGPKAAAAKAEPKAAAAKADAVKAEEPKTAAAKAEPKSKVEATKSEPKAAKAEPKPKAEAVKAEPKAAKAEAVKVEEPEAKAAKAEPKPKAEAVKAEPKAAKAEPKAKAAKAEEPKAKAATAKTEPKAKVAPAKAEEPKAEAVKAEEPKVEAVKAEEPKVEAAKVEEPKTEEPKAEEPKAEEPAAEAPAPEQPANKETDQAEPVAEEPVVEVRPEYADVPGVLIASAECAPLVKVGGLADVVGALPKYLKKLGIDARIIMPFHRQIKDKYADQTQHLCDFQASLGWRSQYVGLEKLEMDDTIYYFIDNEFYFGGPVYCGGEFEGEQYAFFTRAVMDAIPQLDFDVQILHCNDWHTAMMPLLARTQYQGGVQERLRTIQTIHNLHFQGQFSHEFDRDLLRIDDSLATPQFIEHYGCDNMLKAGIVFANKVNTVSPTYSQEICGPELGESLEGVLRSRGGDLWGILNGIDTDVWDPQTDPCLPMRYSAKSLWRKAKDKDALLEELGLAPAGPDTPVIAMVGRLTPQKGIDLVRWALDEILWEDVRIIVLGTGDAEYEDSLRAAEYRYKGKLCSYIGYNGELSHRIYAGSDLFLMPSLFEPCGISQMIAMRYGTLPIVRETGGLKDTVVPYNQYTGEGNGFSFAHYDVGEMLDCIRYAISVWRDPAVRKRLIEQAMACDFSFDRCARAYAELYRSVL